MKPCKEKKEPSLVTISGNHLKFSHGCIISTAQQSRILYSKLLHNDKGQCTHLLLYLDSDIFRSTHKVSSKENSHVHDMNCSFIGSF